jgi:hypothetical protein
MPINLSGDFVKREREREIDYRLEPTKSKERHYYEFFLVLRAQVYLYHTEIGSAFRRKEESQI